MNNCLSRIWLDDEKLENFIRKKRTSRVNTPPHTKTEDSHSGDDGSEDGVGGNDSSSQQGEETLPSEEDSNLHDVQGSPSSRLDDEDHTSEGGKEDEHQGGAKKRMEPAMMYSHHHHISISRWWHRMEKSKRDMRVSNHQTGRSGAPSRRKRSFNLAWFSLWSDREYLTIQTKRKAGS